MTISTTSPISPADRIRLLRMLKDSPQPNWGKLAHLAVQEAGLDRRPLPLEQVKAWLAAAQRIAKRMLVVELPDRRPGRG